MTDPDYDDDGTPPDQDPEDWADVDGPVDAWEANTPHDSVAWAVDESPF